VILNLYGITFHPVVVLGPEHDFLFKPASTYCDRALMSKCRCVENDTIEIDPKKTSLQLDMTHLDRIFGKVE
jgi:hypothetical protein